jgi:hypothetical protein
MAVVPFVNLVRAIEQVPGMPPSAIRHLAAVVVAYAEPYQEELDDGRAERPWAEAAVAFRALHRKLQRSVGQSPTKPTSKKPLTKEIGALQLLRRHLTDMDSGTIERVDLLLGILKDYRRADLAQHPRAREMLHVVAKLLFTHEVGPRYPAPRRRSSLSNREEILLRGLHVLHDHSLRLRGSTGAFRVMSEVMEVIGLAPKATQTREKRSASVEDDYKRIVQKCYADLPSWPSELWPNSTDRGYQRFLGLWLGHEPPTAMTAASRKEWYSALARRCEADRLAARLPRRLPTRIVPGPLSPAISRTSPHLQVHEGSKREPDRSPR